MGTVAWATKVLGVPAHLIRVIACPQGGGFGGKTDPFNHEIACAKAAMVLGRPVKICLTREEVFYCHRGRHPVLMHLKTGVKKAETAVRGAVDVPPPKVAPPPNLRHDTPVDTPAAQAPAPKKTIGKKKKPAGAKKPLGRNR